jgi:hypothetical protein
MGNRYGIEGVFRPVAEDEWSEKLYQRSELVAKVAQIPEPSEWRVPLTSPRELSRATFPDARGAIAYKDRFLGLAPDSNAMAQTIAVQGLMNVGRNQDILVAKLEPNETLEEERNFTAHEFRYDFKTIFSTRFYFNLVFGRVHPRAAEVVNVKLTPLLPEQIKLLPLEIKVVELK